MTELDETGRQRAQPGFDLCLLPGRRAARLGERPAAAGRIDSLHRCDDNATADLQRHLLRMQAKRSSNDRSCRADLQGLQVRAAGDGGMFHDPPVSERRRLFQ